MAHWKPKAHVETSELAAGLHAISATSVSPKGVRSGVHAYLLERPDGNLLFGGPDRSGDSLKAGR